MKNVVMIFFLFVLNMNFMLVELFIVLCFERLKKEKIVIDGNDRDKNGKNCIKWGSKKIYLKYGFFIKFINLYECFFLVFIFKL